MKKPIQTPATLTLTVIIGLLSVGCADYPYYHVGDETGETGDGDGDGDEITTGDEETTDPTTTGDGDGDTGDGDGDSGDGDGDTGDGDTGDGDGDGDGDGFTPDPDAWYRLKTEFQGPAKCLESNDTDWFDWHGGNAFVDDCQDVTGQFWRFEPAEVDGEVWYRMKSMFQGDNKCLQGNNPDELFQGGAAFMADCQDNPDQLWALVEWNGWFHLETKLQGDAKCLEGNEAGSPFKQGAAFMGACEPFLGQNFHLTIQHYSPDMCEPMGDVIGVQGLDGITCTFECEVKSDCPVGPDGTDANCGLVLGETGGCGLWCTPGNDQCPAGSSCKPFPGDEQVGMCMY